MVTLVNRAKMATSTTGTGTITLGSAVTGFQTFADAGITNGMTVRYVIENGDNFEIGSGTYTASGTTLSRTVSESSNSNNALNLSGSSEVFLTAIAADIDAKLDKSGGTMTGVLAMGSNAITTSSTVDGRDLSADGTKLDAIEASATADQTASEIRALVESASDSNVFTDADHSKLNAIEASATADQTDAEIRAAVEAASDSNVFTDADHSKLNGIEASADVTDTTNVTAAGALMDSEVTNLAEVKAFDSSDYATAAQGTLATNALPKSGGTITGTTTFADNVKLAFGNAGLTNPELEIYSNGSSSLIENTAGGIAPIYMRASHIYLRRPDSPYDKFIDCNKDASVDIYYDGALKFATTNTGISITDDIAVSGTVDGRDIATDGTKLDGIEANATADQTDEEIQDIVGAMVTGNTETGITVTYQDADGTLDFSVASQTDNNFTTTLKNKLDAIEASATADQTAAEIRTLVESATDSNVFTDADHTKLNGIEANATADQSNAEIRAAVEAASDSNVFTDADHTKLNGIEASADVTDTANVVAALSAGTGVAISGAGEITVTAVALTTVQTASSQSAHLALTAQEGDVVVRSDENKSYMHNGGTAGTMSDYTLLATPTDAVLSVNGNTGAISAAQIATAVEAASDSNTFTDADHSKLNGIEASATADQTAAEIRTLVESASDSNVFTDADHSKLNGIEASADVTDATNVTAAGALMDSEVTNLAQVKAFDSSDYATAAQGTTADAALPKSGGTMTGDIAMAEGTKVTLENNTTSERMLEMTNTGVATFGFTTPSNDTIQLETSTSSDKKLSLTNTGSGSFSLEANGDITVSGTVDGRDVATDGTKLDTIETNADVTDTANVTSAGALMDSECASLADVKALNQSLVTTATPTFARLKLTQTTVAANSSATTLDFSAANNFLVNMSADTTFTWSNLSGAVGCSGNIVLVQDATGGRDFTLPSQAKKPINGATIVQNTGANEISVLSYYVMSSSQVLVNYIGDFA